MTPDRDDRALAGEFALGLLEGAAVSSLDATYRELVRRSLERGALDDAEKAATEAKYAVLGQ